MAYYICPRCRKSNFVDNSGVDINSICRYCGYRGEGFKLVILKQDSRDESVEDKILK